MNEYAAQQLLQDCKEYLQQDPATVGGRPEADRLVKRIDAEAALGTHAKKQCDCAAHSAADCVCGAWEKPAPFTDGNGATRTGIEPDAPGVGAKAPCPHTTGRSAGDTADGPYHWCPDCGALEGLQGWVLPRNAAVLGSGK